MEGNNSPQPAANNGRSLGIAGMVLGIVSIIVSFIPCFGWWALVMAIVGLILSAVSMSQARKAGAPKGMAITGIICSIIAIIIVIVWILLFAKGVEMAADITKDALQKSGAMDSLNKALEQLKEVTDSAAANNK